MMRGEWSNEERDTVMPAIRRCIGTRRDGMDVGDWGNGARSQHEPRCTLRKSSQIRQSNISTSRAPMDSSKGVSECPESHGGEEPDV